eukprot:414937-Hanusia_phi.AAC.3
MRGSAGLLSRAAPGLIQQVHHPPPLVSAPHYDSQPVSTRSPSPVAVLQCLIRLLRVQGSDMAAYRSTACPAPPVLQVRETVHG